jgi:RimJ/RimL family protein N-acetyltransferase
MTPEIVEVRRAGESDIAGLIALLESVAAEGRWIATEVPLDREPRANRIRATLSRDDATYFVAVVGDEIVGEVGMFSNWPGLCELGMAIEAPWRGKGIGSRLVEAAIVWARSIGAHKIALTVFPHNAAAIALYEKFGFVREGRHPRHMRRKTGEIWDVIPMGLLLSE